MKDHIKFKFNGGRGAVLCSNCCKIIMSGGQIPEEIWDVATDVSGKHSIEELPPMFCSEECKKEYEKKKKSH